MTLPQPEPQEPKQPLWEPRDHDANYDVARWLVMRIIWVLDEQNPHRTGASAIAIQQTAYRYGIASGWFAVNPDTIPRVLHDAVLDRMLKYDNGAFMVTRKGADWFKLNWRIPYEIGPEI